MERRVREFDLVPLCGSFLNLKNIFEIRFIVFKLGTRAWEKNKRTSRFDVFQITATLLTKVF